MPNWCYNAIEIKGDTRAIRDLNIALRATDPGTNVEEELLGFVTLPGFEDTEKQTKDEDWILPQFESECALVVGTYEISEDGKSIKISGDTAWESASSLVGKISENFPVEITLEYSEGGSDYLGFCHGVNGVVIDQWRGHTDDFLTEYIDDSHELEEELLEFHRHLSFELCEKIVRYQAYLGKLGSSRSHKEGNSAICAEDQKALKEHHIRWEDYYSYTQAGVQNVEDMAALSSIGCDGERAVSYALLTGKTLSSEELTALTTARIASRSYFYYICSGYSLEEMVELNNGGVGGAQAAMYSSAGLNNPETKVNDILKITGDVSALYALSFGSNNITTVEEMLAARKETALLGHAAEDLYNIQACVREDFGNLGERICNAHKLPLNTYRIISRNKNTRQALENLDDETLKTVVGLYEVTELEELTEEKADAVLEMFRL